MDLLYLLKPSDTNVELRYSLRSLKFLKYDNVFTGGYKPRFVTGVKTVPVAQNKTKWLNVLDILRAVCDSDISDTFAVMNDDFIFTAPYTLQNYCNGTLQQKAGQYAGKETTLWRKAFGNALDILAQLKCGHTANFELHLPLVVEKAKLYLMLTHPVVTSAAQTHGVLHYRSIYGNLFLPPCPSIKDVKIPRNGDYQGRYATFHCISVFDGVIGSPKYPKLNTLLNTLEKSKFEV